MNPHSKVHLTNGSFVIIYDKTTPLGVKVLVTQSNRGVWGLPGGQVDYDNADSAPYEPYLGALIREVEEEIGWAIPEAITQKIQPVSLCQQVVFIDDRNRKLRVIGTVVLYALEKPELFPEKLRLQESEVTNTYWLSLDSAIRQSETSGESIWLGLAYRRMLIQFDRFLLDGKNRNILECNLGRPIIYNDILV